MSAHAHTTLRLALDATGRPFHFNLCIWGNANVWDWGARVVRPISLVVRGVYASHTKHQSQGHSWRMSGDASASWSYITSIITTNVQHLDSIDFYSHNDM